MYLVADASPGGVIIVIALTTVVTLSVREIPFVQRAFATLHRFMSGPPSAPRQKYVVSAERQAEIFDRRPGETAEQMVARQLDMVTPFESVWLYMVRDQKKQHEAMALLQSTRSVIWTRRAVYAALALGLLNIPLAIVVAFIARG